VSDETLTKIVIQHSGNQAIIGVKKNDFDPIFFMAEGSIQDAVNHVSDYINEAEISWMSTPHYPKAELPTPPPAQTTAMSRQASSTTTKPANKPQEAMF
jgi:hypothetical protein